MVRMSTLPTLLCVDHDGAAGVPGGTRMAARAAPPRRCWRRDRRFSRRVTSPERYRPSTARPRPIPPMPDLTICVGWHWRRKGTLPARRRPTAPPWRGRRISPRPTTTWECWLWPGVTPRRRPEFRGGGEGETRLSRGLLQPGGGARRPRRQNSARESDTPDAVGAYREAVRLKPAEPSYRLNLGAALRRQGDFDGALAAFKEATRLAPQDPLAWVNLGMIQSDQKAYDDAAVSLERATKLNPEYALAWNRLGRVELRRGHLDRAVDAAAARPQARPEERRRRRRSLPDAHRKTGCQSSHCRLSGGGGSRRAESPGPLRTRQGAGREGGLRGGAQGDWTGFGRSPGSSRRRGRRQTRLPERAASRQRHRQLRPGRKRRSGVRK